MRRRYACFLVVLKRGKLLICAKQRAYLSLLPLVLINFCLMSLGFLGYLGNSGVVTAGRQAFLLHKNTRVHVTFAVKRSPTQGLDVTTGLCSRRIVQHPLYLADKLVSTPYKCGNGVAMPA